MQLVGAQNTAWPQLLGSKNATATQISTVTAYQIDMCERQSINQLKFFLGGFLQDWTHLNAIPSLRTQYTLSSQLQQSQLNGASFLGKYSVPDNGFQWFGTLVYVTQNNEIMSFPQVLDLAQIHGTDMQVLAHFQQSMSHYSFIKYSTLCWKMKVLVGHSNNPAYPSQFSIINIALHQQMITYEESIQDNKATGVLLSETHVYSYKRQPQSFFHFNHQNTFTFLGIAVSKESDPYTSVFMFKREAENEWTVVEDEYTGANKGPCALKNQQACNSLIHENRAAIIAGLPTNTAHVAIVKTVMNGLLSNNNNAKNPKNVEMIVFETIQLKLTLGTIVVKSQMAFNPLVELTGVIQNQYLLFPKYLHITETKTPGISNFILLTEVYEFATLHHQGQYTGFTISYWQQEELTQFNTQSNIKHWLQKIHISNSNDLVYQPLGIQGVSPVPTAFLEDSTEQIAVLFFQTAEDTISRVNLTNPNPTLTHEMYSLSPDSSAQFYRNISMFILDSTLTYIIGGSALKQVYSVSPDYPQWLFDLEFYPWGSRVGFITRQEFNTDAWVPNVNQVPIEYTHPPISNSVYDQYITRTISFRSDLFTEKTGYRVAIDSNEYITRPNEQIPLYSIYLPTLQAQYNSLDQWLQDTSILNYTTSDGTVTFKAFQLTSCNGSPGTTIIVTNFTTSIQGIQPLVEVQSFDQNNCQQNLIFRFSHANYPYVYYGKWEVTYTFPNSETATFYLYVRSPTAQSDCENSANYNTTYDSNLFKYTVKSIYPFPCPRQNVLAQSSKFKQQKQGFRLYFNKDGCHKVQDLSRYQLQYQDNNQQWTQITDNMQVCNNQGVCDVVFNVNMNLVTGRPGNNGDEDHLSVIYQLYIPWALQDSWIGTLNVRIQFEDIFGDTYYIADSHSIYNGCEWNMINYDVNGNYEYWHKSFLVARQYYQIGDPALTYQEAEEMFLPQIWDECKFTSAMYDTCGQNQGFHFSKYVPRFQNRVWSYNNDLNDICDAEYIITISYGSVPNTISNAINVNSWKNSDIVSYSGNKPDHKQYSVSFDIPTHYKGSLQVGPLFFQVKMGLGDIATKYISFNFMITDCEYAQIGFDLNSIPSQMIGSIDRTSDVLISFNDTQFTTLNGGYCGKIQLARSELVSTPNDYSSSQAIKQIQRGINVQDIVDIQTTSISEHLEVLPLINEQSHLLDIDYDPICKSQLQQYPYNKTISTYTINLTSFDSNHVGNHKLILYYNFQNATTIQRTLEIDIQLLKCTVKRLTFSNFRIVRSTTNQRNFGGEKRYVYFVRSGKWTLQYNADFIQEPYCEDLQDYMKFRVVYHKYDNRRNVEPDKIITLNQKKRAIHIQTDSNKWVGQYSVEVIQYISIYPEFEVSVFNFTFEIAKAFPVYAPRFEKQLPKDTLIELKEPNSTDAPLPLIIDLPKYNYYDWDSGDTVKMQLMEMAEYPNAMTMVQLKGRKMDRRLKLEAKMPERKEEMSDEEFEELIDQYLGEQAVNILLIEESTGLQTKTTFWFRVVGKEVEEKEEEEEEEKIDEEIESKIEQWIDKQVDVMKQKESEYQEKEKDLEKYNMQNTISTAVKNDVKVQPVKIHMKQISRDGLVTLKFNQKLKVPDLNNILTGRSNDTFQRLNTNQNEEESINKKRSLQQNKPKEQPIQFDEIVTLESNDENIRYTTELQEWKSDRLKFRMDFDDPGSVSADKNNLHQMSLKILKPQYFVSEKYNNTYNISEQSVKMTQSIPRQLPPGLKEEKLSKQAENQTKAITALLIIQLVLAVIMKSQKAKLWRMIATLQIVVYMPIYKVTFPANVEIFLDSIKKIAEFDVFEKDLVMDTMGLDAFFYEIEHAGMTQEQVQHMTHEKLSGFQSHMMLSNMILYIAIFGIVVIALLLFSSLLLIRCCRDKVLKKLKSMKENFIWNGFIQTMQMIYLKTFISLVMALEVFTFATFGQSVVMAVSSSIAVLSAFLIMFYPIWATWILKTNKGQLETKKVMQKYSNLYKNLKKDDKIALIFPLAYVIRRIVFSLMALTYTKLTYLQVQTMLLLESFYLIYVGYSIPYESKFDQRLELFNEWIILTLFNFLFLFTAFGDFLKLDTQHLIGHWFISLVSFCMVINIIQIAIDLRRPVKLWWLKKKHAKMIKEHEKKQAEQKLKLKEELRESVIKQEKSFFRKFKKKQRKLKSLQNGQRDRFRQSLSEAVKERYGLVDVKTLGQGRSSRLQHLGEQQEMVSYSINMNDSIRSESSTKNLIDISFDDSKEEQSRQYQQETTQATKKKQEQVQALRNLISRKLIEEFEKKIGKVQQPPVTRQLKRRTLEAETQRTQLQTIRELESQMENETQHE